MPRPVRVMVSSCGRRVQLMEGFRRAFDSLQVAGSVVTCDAGDSAPASFLSDRHFRVPPADDSSYVPTLLGICMEERIDLVIPTIDTELGVLAHNREVFGAQGTTLVISDDEAIAIAADKRLTHDWLEDSEFSCPQQWELKGELLNNVPLPVILKPARGSMSHGVEIVHDREHLDRVVGRSAQPLIAQTIATGIEYTVSTYVDGSGRCVAAVPRRRLEVRAGEVSKAITQQIPEVEHVASKVVESLPGARGPLNVQIFFDQERGTTTVIEVNARFGGGDPLAWRAGADAPRWIIEEHLGLPITAAPWEDGLSMLRFDDAVYVRKGVQGA